MLINLKWIIIWLLFWLLTPSSKQCHCRRSDYFYRFCTCSQTRVKGTVRKGDEACEGTNGPWSGRERKGQGGRKSDCELLAPHSSLLLGWGRGQFKIRNTLPSFSAHEKFGSQDTFLPFSFLLKTYWYPVWIEIVCEPWVKRIVVSGTQGVVE